MALTNPNKLINVQELNYFEGKLAGKYQTQAITAITGLNAETVEGALAELLGKITSIPSAIIPKGTRTFSQLAPSTDLAAGSLGFMWNISDAFTTTSDFAEGSGKPVAAGSNVYVANVGSAAEPSYKYDIFAGPIDLSGYKTINSLKSKGTATQGVYFDADGNAQAMTYELNKTVPSDAVFTDTTYESKTAAESGTDVSLVTTGEKYAWNAKYDLPANGIPATDLASAVQTSLGLADSAYQKPSGGIPDTDLSSAVQTSLGLADSAYQKPSGGIPSTDLAESYKTTQTAVNDPSAGNAPALEFIATISQNTNGVITATKQGIQVAANSDIDEIFA